MQSRKESVSLTDKINSSELSPSFRSNLLQISKISWVVSVCSYRVARKYCGHHVCNGLGTCGVCKRPAPYGPSTMTRRPTPTSQSTPQHWWSQVNTNKIRSHPTPYCLKPVCKMLLPSRKHGFHDWALIISFVNTQTYSEQCICPTIILWKLV